MANLSYRTAGESHGPGMAAMVEGFPAGVRVNSEAIDADLARRQGGYGRGARQKLERDRGKFLAGVRKGVSTGAPILIFVENRDSRLDDTPAVTLPRPGHADLAGAIKWHSPDARNTLERSSARETAARVAAGALAKSLLAEFGIAVTACVTAIGSAVAEVDWSLDAAALAASRDASDVYCPDEAASATMRDLIRQAKIAGDTLGGVIEVRATGVPAGLGSCMQHDLRLDARIAGSVMAIQAIKGVEVGLGFESAKAPGSQVHDPIHHSADASGPAFGFTRGKNNAGGIEGGITNGMPVVVRAAMKPIPTLIKPLASVDISKGMAPAEAMYERSDVCAVPAASVVVECVVAFEIARVLIEKLGGDTLEEMKANYENYRRLVIKALGI